MKRKVLVGILILVLVLGMAGCQKKTPVNNPDSDMEQEEGPTAGYETEPEEEEELPVVTVGVCKTMDALPLFLMQEEDLDRERGFVLNVQQFGTFAEQKQALLDGVLDGVLTDSATVFAVKEQGTELRIVGPADTVVCLLAGPKVEATELSECRGKMVCMPENTGMEYILDYMLAQSNYVDTYVDKSQADAYETVLMILREEPDLLVLLPEPYAGMARQQGAVVLATSQECGLSPFVTAFCKGFLDNNEDLAAGFCQAYRQAVTDLSTKTEEEKRSLFSVHGGLENQDLEGLTWNDYRLSQVPSEEELEDVYFWCQSKGLYSGEFDLGNLIDVPEE